MPSAAADSVAPAVALWIGLPARRRSPERLETTYCRPLSKLRLGLITNCLRVAAAAAAAAAAGCGIHSEDALMCCEGIYHRYLLVVMHKKVHFQLGLTRVLNYSSNKLA